MKSDGQRLDQTKFLETQFGWIELLSRHGDVFRHGAVSLHTKRFVELASVGATPATGRALATIGVRRHGDIGAFGQCRMLFASAYDRSRYFVAKYAREAHHWVFSPKRIEIASAKADPSHFEQQTVSRSNGLINRFHCCFAGLLYDQRFHISILAMLKFSHCGQQISRDTVNDN